jgi:hypothetical protein
VDLLKKVRAEPTLSGLPVFVLTNAFIPAMIKDATEAGATRVFNKAEVSPRLVIDALKDAGCFASET